MIIKCYPTEPTIGDRILLQTRTRKKEIIRVLHLIDRMVLSDIHTPMIDNPNELLEVAQCIVNMTYEDAERICMGYIPSIQGDNKFKLNEFIFELHDYINSQKKPIHFVSRTVYWVIPGFSSRKKVKLVQKVLKEINRLSIWKDRLF